MSISDIITLATVGGGLWLGYKYIQTHPATAPIGQASTPSSSPSVVYIMQQPAAQQVATPQVVYVQAPAQQTQQAQAQQQYASQYSNYGGWLPDLSTNASPGAPSSSAGPDWLGCA